MGTGLSLFSELDPDSENTHHDVPDVPCDLSEMVSKNQLRTRATAAGCISSFSVIAIVNYLWKLITASGQSFWLSVSLPLFTCLSHHRNQSVMLPLTHFTNRKPYLSTGVGWRKCLLNKQKKSHTPNTFQNIFTITTAVLLLSPVYIFPLYVTVIELF